MRGHSGRRLAGNAGGRGHGGAGRARRRDGTVPMRVVIYDYADVPEAALDPASAPSTGSSHDRSRNHVDGPGPVSAAMPDDIVLRRAFVDAVLQMDIVSPAMHRKLGMHGHTAGSAIRHTPRRVWLAQVKRSSSRPRGLGNGAGIRRRARDRAPAAARPLVCGARADAGTS